MDKRANNKSELLEKAKNGNCEAQYQLGIQYLGREERFDSVEKNFYWEITNRNISEEAYTEGISWLEKAAEQGLEKAQFALGVFYHKGLSVIKSGATYWIMKRNVERGIYWYTKVAEKGNKWAAYALQCIYSDEENFEKTIYWGERAEEYYSIALLYEENEDYDKALEYCNLTFAHKSQDIDFFVEYFEDYGRFADTINSLISMFNQVSQSQGQRQKFLRALEKEIKVYKYLAKKQEIGQAAFKEYVNKNIRSLCSEPDINEEQQRKKSELLYI